MTPAEFARIDMRVGRIVEVLDFPTARRPAWRLSIELGTTIGVLTTSAQVTNYPRAELLGRLVVVAVNLGVRQIGPVRSECLVLGAVDAGGAVTLLEVPDGTPVGIRIA
ncbi:tRNA-binding protein [Pseudofrankia asymbiotica]|uniref:tRNA-binding protein n=1 Tax=Pseudofrankia asymbiotica TaxID=1834516 RepID=A0A1V2ID98_9ACTN|nr:tRNA-binding protein [Pseudofrankia asymbiotica]ONH31162.1 tRNA-binding protein [Pseudofrankia asymbiotica]